MPPSTRPPTSTRRVPMRFQTCTLLVASTLACAASHASSEYSIDWHVIGAGGGVSAAGPYVLRAVIGQPIAHGAVNAGPYTITDGFLAIPLGDDEPACPGDTNGDGQVNFADLNSVLSVFGQTGANLPADVNGD